MADLRQSPAENTIGSAQRTATIRQAVARLCQALGWPYVHELRLPDGRRADVFAVRGDGGFVIFEVKSCLADFQADGKWWEYRLHCDALYFAVDEDFPDAIVPAGPGLVVVDRSGATVVRQPDVHAIPAARRKQLLHRFAMTAATRLALLTDPVGPDRNPARAD